MGCSLPLLFLIRFSKWSSRETSEMYLFPSLFLTGLCGWCSWESSRAGSASWAPVVVVVYFLLTVVEPPIFKEKRVSPGYSVTSPRVTSEGGLSLNPRTIADLESHESQRWDIFHQINSKSYPEISIKKKEVDFLFCDVVHSTFIIRQRCTCKK